MNLSLIPLYTKGRLDFEEDVDIDLKDERILSIDKVHIAGTIIDNGSENYELKMTITGQLTLKSSINGSPVAFPLSIEYDEFIENLVEKYKNSANTLDILPIIWENILLEIPIRATNESDTYEVKSGNGWEVL